MGKKKFTIDGRSFAYRDPNNPAMFEKIDREELTALRNERFRQTGSPGGNFPYNNPHSYSFTNPLYDYDESTVKKAAKKLGIQNVDEREEVSKILDFIRGSESKSVKEEPEEELEDEIIPSEPTPEFPPDDYGAPGPVDFETRMEEATYPPFAGSYFDFVGGDPSNPADYYMGDPDRGGTTRYFGDDKFLIEDGAPGAVVPDEAASYIRAVQDPEYIATFGLRMDEEEDKGYETEEDRVSSAMAGGIGTIATTFRDRAMGGGLVGGLVGSVI